MATWGCSGCRESTKCRSGVLVYMQARLESAPRHIWDVLRQVAADKLDLLRVDLPIDVLRRAGNAAGSVKSGLYASIVVLDGKAIEHVAVVRLPDKDGEAV